MNRSKAEEIIKKSLEIYYPNVGHSLETVEELVSIYLESHTTWKELLRDLSEFFSDAFFNFDAVKFADAAKGEKKLFYKLA